MLNSGCVCRELKKKEVAAAKAAEAGSEAAVAAAQPEAHGVKAEGALGVVQCFTCCLHGCQGPDTIRQQSNQIPYTEGLMPRYVLHAFTRTGSSICTADRAPLCKLLFKYAL